MTFSAFFSVFRRTIDLYVLGLCIIILSLLSKDYRNSLLEVRKTVFLLKTRVKEFVEI